MSDIHTFQILKKLKDSSFKKKKMTWRLAKSYSDRNPFNLEYVLENDKALNLALRANSNSY